MSTNSYIGIENEDASVSYIYCHQDGYIAGVGAGLLDGYNTREAAQALVESGDQSALGEPYSAHPGELWEDIKPLKARGADFPSAVGSNYAYIFSAKTNSWVVRRPGSVVMVGLRRALQKNL